MKTNIDNLYKVYPVLEKINDMNEDIISNSGVFRKIYADEFVVSKSKEKCNGIIFVIKGNIKIQKINVMGEETYLYNIQSGEFCHEVLNCIEDLESLNIIGRALQDSLIFILPFSILKNYLLKDIDFLMYIYKDIHNKFNGIIEHKENLIHESVENRLIKLLINKGSNIIYGTHSDLAFEIDTAREVVSRKLKNIEKLGYIKLERGKITIIKNLNELT